jgi:hypothetical protein
MSIASLPVGINWCVLFTIVIFVKKEKKIVYLYPGERVAALEINQKHFSKNRVIFSIWRHGTQHNNNQHNDTQHNDTQHTGNQHYDTQHNDT